MKISYVTALIAAVLSLPVAADEYLGNYSSNKYNANSTSNPYGAGSPYNADSVNNRYGRY